ncbi:MAG: hypothetical protein KGL39_17735 [Patescibacteria group bacterium]|nr:hypothetical protein [Patescibacteria group bacterium]
MSKQKQSKLDAYAERLTEWFTPKDKGGQGLTLAEAREQLRLDGCSVSLSRLSDWWAEQQSRRQQEQLLARITTGSQQIRDVEQEFAKNPAPALETLIKLHRVLILRLSTEATDDTEKLELVNRMMREVQKFARLEQLGEQIALERDKFQFDASTACLKALPELKAISTDKTLSEPQKVQQIRLKLFGTLADQA